ncbi:putative 5xTM membrane YitT family protein [Melghirimyces profundicolus]|uniref:Putative 5xTM membrane YitT family protein n=1 Tax=Melghirimyces profundicolus TaxID=1242148 RepID=A0A2T6BGB3_9BACL|nr:YitT family protein [Melghirimyces profundicolus]PTX55081.1 putative 5xTM membrane YitT family protein [Melghirimyces profundicolus]
MILLGSSLVAVGLEIFLVPNHIIDGDIVGVSIILSYLSGLPSGAFLFCLNLPFFFWGYKAIGDIHDVKGGRFKKRNIH